MKKPLKFWATAAALLVLSCRSGNKDEMLAMIDRSLEKAAAPGTSGNFILMHSVGSMPHNSEVDVPLTYADYYYVEAMMRYKKLFGG
jgi:hypothetical protein